METTEERNGDDRERTALRAAFEALGLLCLLAALALLGAGVRIARADEPAALMSTDPTLVAKGVDSKDEAAVGPPPDGAASALAAEIEATKQERPRAVIGADGQLETSPLAPGVAGVEIAPGVIRLNTRGYNYSAASDAPAPPGKGPGAVAPSAPPAARSASPAVSD